MVRSSSNKSCCPQVSISEAADPCLELDCEQEEAGSWEEDWDRTVPGEIDPDQPCFILYRLDEKDSSGYRWIFLSWSPDHANTRYTTRQHRVELTDHFQAEDALCFH